VSAMTSSMSTQMRGGSWDFFINFYYAATSVRGEELASR
jgi:hypothetical protein